MASTLNSAIKAAIPAIKSHPAVIQLLGEPTFLPDGRVYVSAEFEVPLPSRCIPNGKSPLGVHAREPVYFIFPSEFPFRSPVIRLRKNFPRVFPHINPGSPEDLVSPCVYDGSLDELLHQTNGLNEILNQISDWLTKAARNDLIDPMQGWEPIRRDEVSSVLIYDEVKFNSFVKKGGGSTEFFCRFFRNDDSYLGKVAKYLDRYPSEQALVNLYNDNVVVDAGEIISCLGLFVWPPEKNNKGEITVVEKYLPDVVTNLKGLISRSVEYGCENLTFQLKKLFDFFKKKHPEPKRGEMLVSIIVCARRPYNLIGQNSSLELIPYLALCRPMQNGPFEGWDFESPVWPLGHRHSISAELCRRMSGSQKSTMDGPIVQLGCGSLGSKISIHLARAGHGPFLLIDRGYLSPHNLARHGLLEARDFLWNYKAQSLSEAISILGQKAEFSNENIVNRIFVKLPKGKIFPKSTQLVIDSSASLAVRESLASVPSEALPGQLVHTGLYASGRIGVMTIEGPQRNPRIDDLAAKLFDLCIDNRGLGEELRPEHDPFGRQQVGQGCGSYTMVMPDTEVSMFAAGFAERCRNILEVGTEAAELWIGKRNNLGIDWSQINLGRTVLATPCNGKDWEIRILSCADKLIEADARLFAPQETGGVLIGKISYARKTATITRVLPPPPDSKRSGTTFVLGTEGLRKKVKNVQDASGGTLSYLGTWHSHPRGGGPSGTDHSTLERMRALRLGFPTINLIWTATGYQALIDDGEMYTG